MKSNLDEMMGLRPKLGADDTAIAIEASICAINARIDAYSEKANDLREKRKNSILILPASQLLAMDNEASELEIAVQQGALILSELRKNLTARVEKDRFEALEAERLKLKSQIEDFGSRFNSTYKDIVEKFGALMEEYKILTDNNAALNGILAQIQPVINVAYFERVALPMPGLSKQRGNRPPMAFLGCFWKNSDVLRFDSAGGYY